MFCLACLIYVCSINVGLAAEDNGDWFFNDFEEKIKKVNEGKLVFLAQPPTQRIHYSQNRMTLKPSSMQDGWIQLVQCHYNLDPVPRLEIVFRKGYIRHLTIQSQQQIGKAWAEDGSVQLEDVNKKAQLCFSAESKSLIKFADGRYGLRNGPYMRKFLDGFYPMHVSMEVKFPKQLRFVSILPRNQKGFKVWQTSQSVHVDTWFEGKLLTEMVFESTQ